MESPFSLESPRNDYPTEDYQVRAARFQMCTLEDGLTAWDKVIEKVPVSAPPVKQVQGNLTTHGVDDTTYRLASYLSSHFERLDSVTVVGSKIAVSAVLMSKITKRVNVVTTDSDVSCYLVDRLKGLIDYSVKVVGVISKVPASNLIVTDEIETVSKVSGNRRVVGVSWASCLISHFEPPFFDGLTDCGNAAITLGKTTYIPPDSEIRKVPLVHATTASKVGRNHSKGPSTFRWLHDTVPTVAEKEVFDPKNYHPELSKMPVAYSSLPVRRIFANFDGSLNVVCFRSDTYFGVLDDGILTEEGSLGDSDLVVYWSSKENPRAQLVVLDYFVKGSHVNYNFSELQVLSSLTWTSKPPGGLYLSGNCDEMYSKDVFGVTYIDQHGKLGKGGASHATHEMLEATLKYSNGIRPKLFQMAGIDFASDRIKVLRETIMYEQE